jgi:hypothetical protein
MIIRVTKLNDFEIFFVFLSVCSKNFFLKGQYKLMWSLQKEYPLISDN